MLLKSSKQSHGKLLFTLLLSPSLALSPHSKTTILLGFVGEYEPWLGNVFLWARMDAAPCPKQS